MRFSIFNFYEGINFLFSGEKTRNYLYIFLGINENFTGKLNLLCRKKISCKKEVSILKKEKFLLKSKYNIWHRNSEDIFNIQRCYICPKFHKIFNIRFVLKHPFIFHYICMNYCICGIYTSCNYSEIIYTIKN